MIRGTPENMSLAGYCSIYLSLCLFASQGGGGARKHHKKERMEVGDMLPLGQGWFFLFFFLISAPFSVTYLLSSHSWCISGGFVCFDLEQEGFEHNINVGSCVMPPSETLNYEWTLRPCVLWVQDWHLLLECYIFNVIPRIRSAVPSPLTEMIRWLLKKMASFWDRL